MWRSFLPHGLYYYLECVVCHLHSSTYHSLQLYIYFCILLVSVPAMAWVLSVYFCSPLYSSCWCSNQLCSDVAYKCLSSYALFIYCICYYHLAGRFQGPADPFQKVELYLSEQQVEQPVTHRRKPVDVWGSKPKVYSTWFLKRLPLGLSPVQWHTLPSFCFFHSCVSPTPDPWIFAPQINLPLNLFLSFVYGTIQVKTYLFCPLSCNFHKRKYFRLLHH